MAEIVEKTKDLSSEAVPTQVGMEVKISAQCSLQRSSITKPMPGVYHHYHNAYEIYYLYAGERYYFIKDKTYHVTRGDLVLIRPFDMHGTTSYSKSGYDRFLINFHKGFVEKLLADIGREDLLDCFDQDMHLIKLDFKEQRFVESLFLAMENEQRNREDGHEIFLQTALLQLLLVINRCKDQLNENVSKYVNSTHKVISEIAAYINLHYSENITLEEISAKFFISPYYFSRTFKKVMRVPFAEYLNGVRIKEAQQLLRRSRMNIAEVAAATGYKSSTHFGRVFKGIVGMSPIAYRKSMKE